MLFHDVTCDRLTRQFGNSGGPLINLVSEFTKPRTDLLHI